jgi:hypothetical protein
LDGRTLGLIGLAVLLLAVLGVLAGLVISRGRQPEEPTPFPLAIEDYVLPDMPGDISNPPFLPYRGIRESWTEADIQPFMPDLRAAASEALRQRSLDAVDEVLDAVPPLR